MFAISTDNENFHSKCPTIEAAIEEAIHDYDYEHFWVGRVIPPPQPETLWAAEDWLEHVSVQDEYSGEWAEEWDGSTDDQRAELETEVRRVMAAWLDRHQLRPKFFNITDPIEYQVIAGQAQRVDRSEPARS